LNLLHTLLWLLRQHVAQPYRRQLDKVNRFYEHQSHQQNERLTLLVDNVKASTVLRAGSEFGGSVTMTPSGNRRKSAADFIVKTMSKFGHRPSKEEKNRVVYDAPDEDLEENPSDSDQRIRESDSVQRALVDHYRTTKLLHNFSIVNYTGFVKIVKKHDKTFPEFKGKYRNAVNDANVCNEGKSTEVLGLKTEKLYADWFCGGDNREALVVS
jgi:hypothetical protein